MSHEDPSHYLDALRERCDGLLVDDWQVLGNGQNSVALLVNGEWVFRFPKHAKSHHSLVNECVALRLVSGKASLQTPQVRWEDTGTDVEAPFLCHRFINGTPLTVDVLRRAGTPELQGIARQIGRFLTELHAIEPSGLAAGDTPKEWVEFAAAVESNLMPLLRPTGRRRLRADLDCMVGELSQAEFEPAFRHGDFGSGNILVDEASMCVTGVIDFGSAAAGDPAVDIAGLLSPVNYVAEFIDLLLAEFPALARLVPKAMHYTRTFPLQEALLGAIDNDSEAVERGLAGYL